MLTYFLQIRDNEKKEIFFIDVEGYKLPNGFAAHKDFEKNTWVLDDLNSGCMVRSGFPTFNNLKANLETSGIQKQVFERRKSERYALLVKRLRERKVVTYNKETEERKEELWDN